jgi:hypothetical protein
MRALAFFLASACAWAAAPVIFFTDLDSGPNTGGENNNGVYVTIYGANFGSTRGSSSVTVGGGSPAQYKVWCSGCWGGTTGTTYDKITVQLGASAASGNIVVSTSGGTSNAVSFTVRSGNIYFVSTAGNDSAAGTFAAPWATGVHARDTMSAGDTVYFRAGNYLTQDDGTGYSTCLRLQGANSGTVSGNNAFIGYPGETVNLGDTNNCGITVRADDEATPNDGPSYWTFAGFAEIIGHDVTFDSYNSHNWRLIGNANMTCPNGNSQSGCLDIGGAHDGSEYNYFIYGNNVNHSGTNNPPGSVTALYHGVYLSQNMHAVWFGWNVVSNAYGGRCLQQNVNNNSSTDAASVYDMHIHDNWVHDCVLDGIVMTTVNPNMGTVELYNNVIYNAGQGPANAENSGAWSCLYVNGSQNSLASGTDGGRVLVYNNTFYACGIYSNPPYSDSSGGSIWNDQNTNATKGYTWNNNIMYLTTGPASGYDYFEVASPETDTCSSSCVDVTGSNNIFFNKGTTATNTILTNSTFSNPLFTNAGGDVFTLQTGSPALGAGTHTGAPTYDILGNIRPNPPSIGAFDAASGGSVGVSVSVNPPSASLLAALSQQFTATVSGTSNTAVTWSMSPSVGTLSASGLYLAPSLISILQTVTITATSVADSTRSASATVSLTPLTSISVSVTPSSASLSPGQTQQFTATVTGSNSTPVWSLSPATGTLSTTGFYTAPATINASTTVTVTATLGGVSASAIVTLNPSAGAPPPSGSGITRIAPITSGSTTDGICPSMGGTSVSCSLTQEIPAVGQTLFVFAGASSSETWTTPTDAAGNTYTPVLVSNGTSVSIGLWRTVITKAAGMFPISVTGSASAAMTMSLSLYSGVGASDVAVGAPGSGLSMSPGTLTTTKANDLVVSGCTNTNSTSGTAVFTPAAGFLIQNQDINNATDQTLAYQDQIAVAIGSYTPAMGYNMSGGNTWACVAGAFTAGTAPAPTVTVTVNPSSTSIGQGLTQQFTATVSGTSNTAVTWSLSPGVGSISSSGLYTAPSVINAQQTVTVTATSIANPAKSAAATLTLTSGISVGVSPSSASPNQGATQQFTATVSGTSNTSVTWSLSPAVGSISSSGLYTAPSTVSAQQTVTVTATSSANSAKTATATVTLNPVSVSISPSTVSLTQGQTQQYTATVSGSSNTSVTWSLSPAVGSISSSGLYTAPSSISTQQTVTVTAKSVANSAISAAATVTLVPGVSVSLTPALTTLSARQTQQVTATVSGTSNTAVTWSMSPALGSVSSSGMYTAPSVISAQQNVTLTATSVANPAKFAAATVTLKPGVSVTLSPTSISLHAKQTQQFTPTVSTTSNSQTVAVTWSLNPPGVGSVSSSGLYTAPSTISTQQTVTVTATSVADSTKSAVATVTLLTGSSASVRPSQVTLIAGQTQQFTATVPGVSNQAVVWSLNPPVGSISASGQYIAPSELVTHRQSIVVTATPVANPNMVANATVTVISFGGFVP